MVKIIFWHVFEDWKKNLDCKNFPQHNKTVLAIVPKMSTVVVLDCIHKDE